ncbi:MAG: ATP-binding cassette domain-containing protein [Solirubrobacteraceae bacterium]|nr:ATP-binding cassette domain-containing protein [Patulibacter sp.]
MSEPIVTVDELRKRYDGAPTDAVKGISFSIDEGEVFGLLGPNGAGKTTTIGVLTTRVLGTGGTVVVDGFDVSRDATSVKQRIAVVPQRPNLDRSLTALENLTFHAAYFGFSRRARKERAEQLLEAFGLGGRGNERVNNYSGGMAQRLMIARALMHRPRVLFLDEPTTGLDPQARLFLWDQIEELRDAGTTILLTTHDMVEAERLCHRIAIVDHGERIALDTPRGLRQLLPSSGGLEVIADHGDGPSGADGNAEGGAPGADALIATLRAALEPLGDAELDEVDDGRVRVRLFGNAAPGAVASAVEGAGALLISLRRLEGTLEDVFVHLTGRDLR